MIGLLRFLQTLTSMARLCLGSGSGRDRTFCAAGREFFGRLAGDGVGRTGVVGHGCEIHQSVGVTRATKLIMIRRRVLTGGQMQLCGGLSIAANRQPPARATSDGASKSEQGEARGTLFLFIRGWDSNYL